MRVVDRRIRVVARAIRYPVSGALIADWLTDGSEGR